MAEFEKIIEESLQRIPAEFKRIIEKENIKLIAREKAPAPLQNSHKGGVVFGVFIGVPYNQRSVFNIEKEPTRIELYKQSFEEIYPDGRDMEAQIAKTVVHEIGHYFGFSEKALRTYKF